MFRLSIRSCHIRVLKDVNFTSIDGDYLALNREEGLRHFTKGLYASSG